MVDINPERKHRIKQAVRLCAKIAWVAVDYFV